MSKIAGTTVLDTIVPPATTSKFPTHDSQYGKGGWRELNSWGELRSITRDRMRAGMAISIIGEGPYILKSMGEDYDEDVWQPVRGEKGERGERQDMSITSLRISVDTFEKLWSMRTLYMVKRPRNVRNSLIWVIIIPIMVRGIMLTTNGRKMKE